MQFVQFAVKRGWGYDRTRSVNVFNSRKVVCVKALGTRQQGGEQRQSKVRSAAGELFRARGFDATSVRDIAAAAGVSVGTVAHIGDKATLFLDVMEENAFALVGGALERLSGEPVGTSLTLAAEIWGVFEPSLTRIAKNPELTRAYLIAYLRAHGPQPPAWARVTSSAPGSRHGV